MYPAFEDGEDVGGEGGQIDGDRRRMQPGGVVELVKHHHRQAPTLLPQRR
jgi:hypothetical protein